MPGRIPSGVAWQIVAGEAGLLDLRRGRAVGLNAVGTFVFPFLDSQSDEEITENLVREFAVEPETARADLSSFLALLRSEGLLLEP